MQRQSLGSPGSKLHCNGAGFAGDKDDRRSGGEPEPNEALEEKIKAEKPIRSSSRISRTVHLIPILTVLCFLVLYFFSHEPSPTDLPSIRGVDRLLHPKGGSVSEIGRYFGAERGGVSGIGKHRGLKEDKRLRHRKLGIP